MASPRKSGGVKVLGDASAWLLHRQPSVCHVLRYWLCFLVFIQQVLTEHLLYARLRWPQVRCTEGWLGGRWGAQGRQ